MTTEIPEDFDICMWCTSKILEGTAHLPTENKGKCIIVGGKVKKMKASHPVGMFASGQLAVLEEQIHKVIFADIKKRFGKDFESGLSATNLIVNWQMGIMNFCQHIMNHTNIMILAGAHMTYMEEMEGKTFD